MEDNLQVKKGQIMKNEKLPRRQREKLRQRQEMLAAALELFSRKGYHNVSMHEVAEKAEFAIGRLYKFFQNKEDLYKVLVLEQSEEIGDTLVQALEKPDDEIEKLRNYVRVKGEVFRSNLPFVRLFVAETRGVSYIIKTGMNEEVRKLYYEFLERLASVFESGIKNRRLKRIAKPYYLAVALDSVVNSYLLLWLEAPERHPYPEDPDTILDIFFKGLIEG
jgi:AcrR family transcriptional regulator